MEILEAFVTPELLIWARKRLNYSVHAAANKLNINPEKLHSWEQGNKRPTFNQAQKLAKKFNVPFGYLFLSKPPQENLPLADLRTIRHKKYDNPSPNFIDTLYDALRKQDWYREYLQGERADTVKFLGKFNTGSDIKTIAADISKTLNINNDLRKHCVNWEHFLTEIIRRAEVARILVLRSGIVGSNTYRVLDVDEFRGFAIGDKWAPLVFINENDYKSAQIFTIVHELVHLWIGESGVSNPDYSLRSKNQKNEIEQFCDRVAAEVLVPFDDFYVRWDTEALLADNLKILARKYRVSSFVILRRAYDLEYINKNEYFDSYNELLKQIKPKNKNSGGDYYRLVLSRNSATLTKSLLCAMNEGQIMPSEAARLLNIGAPSLSSVEGYTLLGEPTNA